MGARLSEDEVQRALDFCVHLFSPTTPEQHESVRRTLSEAMLPEDDEEEVPYARPRTDSSDSQASRGLAERLMDVRAPVVDPGALARLLRSKLSFFRRHSSPSMRSGTSYSTPFNISVSTASFSTTTTSATSPSSPVSDVFSMGARSASSVSELDAADEGGEDEVRMVLDKVNARRVIHAEHGEGLNCLESEALGGLVVRLERGSLGLKRVGDGETAEAGVSGK